MASFLKKHGFRPSKALGQNFLTDKKIIEKIVNQADLKNNEVVLEIGPGTGNLTKALAEKAGSVIAVEKDARLVEILTRELANYNNVAVIEGDILRLISNFQFPIFKQVSSSKFQTSRKYKIVADLPYYLTAPVIRKFLESENPPELMVLLVQKEVAERICVKPPEMNLLAVSVQFYSQPKIVGYVSKKFFWPRPKVDGAVLRITPRVNTNRKLIDTNLFFKIVRAGFSQPRKQIINNLTNRLTIRSFPGLAVKPLDKVKLDKSFPVFISEKKKQIQENKERIKSWLLKNSISPSQRAETLNLQDWINLTKSYEKICDIC